MRFWKDGQGNSPRQMSGHGATGSVVVQRRPCEIGRITIFRRAWEVQALMQMRRPMNVWYDLPG